MGDLPVSVVALSCKPPTSGHFCQITCAVAKHRLYFVEILRFLSDLRGLER